MRKTWILLCCLAAAVLLVRSTIAQEQERAAKSSSASPSTAAAPTNSAGVHDAALPRASGNVAEERAARLEGEKRFRTNCGRCHQPPHKFPPRMMATAIRHMRVRAMITDEDMRFILRYMTQ